MTTNLVPRSSKRTRGFGSIIKSMLQPENKADETDSKTELFNIITKARQELHDAQNFFDNVVDAELIDHAIYRMEAAKSRYAFLLKNAKDNGVRIDI